MKKTLFVGLLAAAIMAISFTGCNNNVDPGTAPTIHGVIILTQSDYENTNYWNDALPLAQTNLSLSGNYRLSIKMEDPDKDIVEVAICKNSSFDDYWHWTGLSWDDVAFWGGVSLNFSTMTTAQKESFKMDNGTFYVKIIDSKGNESNIKSVSGITVQ